MEGTIAEKMGRFVAGLSYDNLPEEVIQKAKCCMINGIAIGIYDQWYCNWDFLP
ncbi:MAG: hypothetical protein JRJ82_07150 [Deltaproteobacteria bacterium]|nr:hypothetical protein [Deltaproteobacteria bacterium]